MPFLPPSESYQICIIPPSTARTLARGPLRHSFPSALPSSCWPALYHPSNPSRSAHHAARTPRTTPPHHPPHSHMLKAPRARPLPPNYVPTAPTPPPVADTHTVLANVDLLLSRRQIF
ncbi:extensin-like [Penaeus monodon]|uniref:extensin-like n=1 Tax=Penaeus monodon TaxID=6687 RepID=UPI0018A7DE69|nr:extensin-like [Penaeus monodon]